MNKQKHYLNLAILLMAGLVIAGCQEDEIGGFTPAAPGDAIEFAVNAVKTRTAYVSRTSVSIPMWPIRKINRALLRKGRQPGG